MVFISLEFGSCGLGKDEFESVGGQRGKVADGEALSAKEAKEGRVEVLVVMVWRNGGDGFVEKLAGELEVVDVFGLIDGELHEFRKEKKVGGAVGFNGELRREGRNFGGVDEAEDKLEGFGVDRGENDPLGEGLAHAAVEHGHENGGASGEDGATGADLNAIRAEDANIVEGVVSEDGSEVVLEGEATFNLLGHGRQTTGDRIWDAGWRQERGRH